MSWTTTKLGDIAISIQPGPFGSQLHSSDYSSEGTPIVMPKDMVDGHINHTGLVYVSDEHVTRLNRHLVHEGNLMVARKGDVRKCVYISSAEEGWMTGSDCLKVVLDENKCFPRFIYYELRSQYIGKWLETISIGATMPSINTGLLSGIELFLPPLIIQRQIANALVEYDTLIDNNKKQIHLLEEAAQRLYKEWFTDFRFPGYEDVQLVDGVPEGWKQCRLEDAIFFNPSMTLDKERLKQSVPMSALSTSSMVLDRKEFSSTFSNAGSKFKNGDTLLARITPCLENGKTAFVDNIESTEGAVGSTEYIVMRSKKINPFMVYLLARSDEFRQTAINSMTGSDGRQRVQVDKLKAFRYFLPTPDLIHRFEEIIKPVFDTVSTLNEQCHWLIEARDRLLPKLMSGEITV